jgi:hypothetical protein
MVMEYGILLYGKSRNYKCMTTKSSGKYVHLRGMYEVGKGRYYITRN